MKRPIVPGHGPVNPHGASPHPALGGGTGSPQPGPKGPKGGAVGPAAGGSGSAASGGGGGGAGQAGQGGGGQAGGGQGAGGGKVKGILKQLLGMETKQPVAAPSPTTPTQALTPEAVQNQITALNGNPANALAFSSFVPDANRPDPRDPDYWRNVSNLLFSTQGQITNANLAQERATQDFGKASSDLQTNRTRDQRSLAEQAMRSGLSNSGWLDRTDAEQTHDYLRAEEDLQTGYQRQSADRRADISALIQEYLAGEQELGASAVDRFTQAQMDQAADGAPLYDPAQIRKLQKILKPNKKKGGKN